MRLSILSTWLALVLLATVSPGDASPALSHAEAHALALRAVAQIAARANPSGGYAPSRSACPAVVSSDRQSAYTGFIRSAQGNTLSPNETDYVRRHQQATQQAWTDWLSSSDPGPGLNGGNNGIPGGVQNYTSDLSRLPRVGIALSGGGYRAMINGAGVLMGWDGRNGTAQQRGTAGFLQQALYVAGLSGGSWAVGSLAINDWPQAQQLKDQTWNLAENLVIPKDDALSFYADLVGDVAGKRGEDYPTGIVDYWGRALSYHLVNSSYPDEGQATTWGDIRNTSNFQSAAYPFPLAIADEREPGDLLIYRNTTVFEFNPYEFGSFDPDVAAFVPLDILGTSLVNGVSAEENNQCTYGFDNFGWVVGTSSTLFNALFNRLLLSDGDSLIKDALQSILGAVSKEENDVSVLPNPFRGYRNTDASNTVASLMNITLVDGGEDNQNIPVNTLLSPGRQLDLILAVDSSGDVTDWPNGTALHETFLRYQNQEQYNYVPMPIIPSPNTFVNRGLNTRPTFFGCNATNAAGATPDVINQQTAANGSVAPIIAYIPNYPWSALSNTSTYQLEYSTKQAQQLLDNAVDVATLGGSTNGTAYWPTCLACASLERGFARSKTVRPDVCTQCMRTYCWDGVTNETAPALAYSPPVGTPIFITSGGQSQVAPVYTGGNGTNGDVDSAAANNGQGQPDGASTVMFNTVSSSAMALIAILAILLT